MKNFCWLALLMSSPGWADELPDESQSVIYLGDSGVIVLRFEIQVGGKSPQQCFLKYVDDLIKSADVNEDGVVTLEEARGKYLIASEAVRVQLLSKRDSNGVDTSPDVSPVDGKISRSEFLTYFKRMGLHPFVMQYQPDSPPGGINRQPRNSASPPEIPLFARLDTDRDGMLSTDELKNALWTLRKLDLDDDETISAAELTAISNPFARPPQQRDARAELSSPFLSLGSDESISKQIRRLIDKYDRINPTKSGAVGSKTRNQQLNIQELGISAKAFDRYDGDGDGQLNFDELRQFLTSPEPTITIRINVDTVEPLGAESSDEVLRGKLRTTPDGSANINLGTRQLSIERGPTSNAGTAEELFKPQFIAADADANGYLTQSETERIFLYGATFENLDADKNGKVFLEEATDYFQVRFEAARSRTVLSINDQGRTLFQILDTDRDSRLSFRELQVAADKLSIWDSNGDGLLAPTEVPQQYRLVVARGTLPLMNENFLNTAMDQPGMPAERTSGPVWFRKMDKNRDGEVSSREFLGKTLTFEKLDLNHDGFIDLSEAMKALAE